MNNTMAWISLKHIPWSLLWTHWTHTDGREASADWFIAVRSSSVNNSFEIVSDLFIGSERRTVLISRCSCQFSQIKWIRHFDHWWQRRENWTIIIFQQARLVIFCEYQLLLMTVVKGFPLIIGIIWGLRLCVCIFHFGILTFFISEHFLLSFCSM